MDGAQNAKPVPSQEESTPESAATQTISMDAAMELLNRNSFAGAEKFSLAMERFSVLSTEIITLLMGLSQEINKSAEELNAVRSAVDLKRKELESLLEAEQTARALERQTEDLKRQRDELEKCITEERSSWEADKLRREREAIEREKAWNAEQSKARQEFEEDLRTTRQQNQDAQEAAERILAEREQIIKSKEFEWSQLIQELDQFLSRLAGRDHAPNGIPVLVKEEPSVPLESTASGIPLSGYFRDDAALPQGRMETDLNAQEALMWENVWREQDAALNDRQYLLGNGPAEDTKSSPPFNKDAPSMQNRKAEEPNAESSARRDNAPLRFAPKNSGNHI